MTRKDVLNKLMIFSSGRKTVEFHHLAEKGHVWNIPFKCLKTRLRSKPFCFLCRINSFQNQNTSSHNFILIIKNSWLFNSKLNIAITVNIDIFLKPAFFIEHHWWLLLNSNLILATQILTKRKTTYVYILILATQTK